MGRRTGYKAALKTILRFKRRLMFRRNNSRIMYDCSRHIMFFMSLYGFIPVMTEKEFKRRFGRRAREILRVDEPVLTLSDDSVKRKRKPAKCLRRKKKRKLMPQDYAWLLRSEGRKYATVPIEYVQGAHVHKMTSTEKREKSKEEAIRFWQRRCDEYHRQKENARERHLRAKLGLLTPHEVEKSKRRSVRSVSLRISKPLYEAISYGECVSFNWQEIPGHEHDFLPNASGRRVEVVSVRPIGNDPDYDWISFNVTDLERFYREGSSCGAGCWFWRIGVGRLVENPDWEDDEEFVK